MALINKDEQWLKNMLEQKGIENINDVFYTYMQDSEESFTILTYQY